MVEFSFSKKQSKDKTLKYPTAMHSYRLFLLLICCLWISHYQGLSQCIGEKSYMSFQNGIVTFHKDGTYTYYYPNGSDLWPRPPVKAYNFGRYTKHKNRAYFLYSAPDLYPYAPDTITGKETRGQNSLVHLTLLDSVKKSTEQVDKSMIGDRYDYKCYYYRVKIVYSADSLDSVRLKQRMDQYLQSEALSYSEKANRDSIMAQSFIQNDEQRGLSVVNGCYFQQFICTGQQMDFVPVEGLPVHSIEVEIYPLKPDMDFNYTERFAKCIYLVQQQESTCFVLTIPPCVYRKIHNPYYYQTVVEIVNRQTVIFDNQVFFKLPKDGNLKRTKCGFFYGYKRTCRFVKRHKIRNPYDD